MWTATDLLCGDPMWHRDSVEGTAVWRCAFPGGGYGDNWLQYLTTPPVGIPRRGPVYARMEVSYLVEPGDNSRGSDWMNLRVSTDGGQTWHELGRTQATAWAQEDFACPAGAANNPDFQVRFRTDGAAELVRLLLEVDHVHFMVGMAVNPAHQNPNLPVALGMKMSVVREIAEELRRRGTEVTIESV